MKKFLLLLAFVMAVAAVGLAATVDCNFDNFTGAGIVPDGYCGITWNLVWTYYDTPQQPYNPHTPPERVYSPSTGAGEYDFTFETPSVFQGAWFAGFAFATVHFNLYDSSHNLLWTSASLDPSDVPTFLASGYGGLVSIVGVFSQSNDFYVMDDVTYAETVTPEPGSLWLLATAVLGAGSAFRKKMRA